MKPIQDEILVLFALVILWLLSIPALAHFNAMAYWVGGGGVIAGMYLTFIGHEASKIIKTGRGADDE